MTEEKQQNEQREDERVDLEEQEAEILPNREVMTIIDPDPGKLGPPLLAE